MIRLRVLLCLAIIGILAVPALADHAESAYKQGLRAEKANNLDAAFQAYKQAYTAKPTDPRFLAAYTRLRFYDSAEHIRAGQQLRQEGKLQEALAEFRLAAQIDGSNFEAMQEVRRTADLIQKQAQANQPAAKPGKKSPSSLEKLANEAAGPIELEHVSDIPITLRMTATTDVVYKTIGKLGGINVLIDSDYKPQKINIELNDVSFREALAMVALQSRTFWRAVSPNTIMVSADTPGKRKEVEENVMKTFYLRNVASPNELQEAANTLKGILDISRIQVIPEHRAMTLRGTPDQMVLAQKLLGDIDKPRPEVLIDVAVMQVSRDRLRNLGTTPPTSASVTLQPTTSSSGTSAASGSGSGSFTLNQLKNLNADGVLVSFPGASMQALMTDSRTKVIQRPEIRALDSEKATLKIGDRVPIATGSFQGGISNLVNTQFQYIDVGVNIDITPYVHSENDVTLKMTLEISSVTGVQNIGGINQPTIGQRRIEHEARLADGEVNLIGGILEDTESTSMSGYPWLTHIPILKYLFGQETRQNNENEIVFAITPHIVRGAEVDDENQRMIDIGTGNNVTYRQIEMPKDGSDKPAGQTPQQPAEAPSQPKAAPPTTSKNRSYPGLR